MGSENCVGAGPFLKIFKKFFRFVILIKKLIQCHNSDFEFSKKKFSHYPIGICKGGNSALVPLILNKKSTISLFPCPKTVGFWPAGFVLVRCIEALQKLISAKSWAFLDTSKELLVLISKGFWKNWPGKAHFELGPRLESPRFEWTWKQANYMALQLQCFLSW